MIKKTRLKFFAVTSGISTLIILIFCGTILMTTRLKDIADARKVLDGIVWAFENRSPAVEIPEDKLPKENQDGIRIQINDFRTFVVKVANSGKIDGNSFPKTSYFTEEEIEYYVEQILSNNKLSGFLVVQKNSSDGKIIAVMDLSIENDAFNRLMLMIVCLGTGGVIMLLLLIWSLSYWMVKPAEQSLAKQKRFVSEASHELKTPLTVISAGVELLQKEKGLSKDAKRWLADIKSQTKKMTKMTTDMLALSKMEEKLERIDTEFDLSGVIHSNALTFESVAFEQNKSLIYDDIEEDIKLKGNIEAVCRAVQILCENALKHSDDKAIIKVSLKRPNGKIILSVINTGGHITQEEIPLLFERFYRGSESRAQTSGTGLGLAILKTLTEQNGWKLDVKVIADKTIFSITF